MKRVSILLAILFVTACANSDIELLKKSVGELSAQNMDLKKEIADVKGSIEEVNRKIKTNTEDTKLNSEALLALKSEMQTFQNKTNERLKALESGLPKGQKMESTIKTQPVVPEGSKVNIEDNIADKTSLYNIAMELYRSNRLDESLNKFRTFVVRYPKDSLADNCLYWMGEIYLQKGDLNKALESFNNVIENYPNENKVPDAIYKAAIVNDSLGKRDEAIKLLKQLRANFKYAEITKAAQDKLKEWGVKNE